MKGAGKYADELKSLVKKFAKEAKAPAITKQDPLRALTRAIFCFDTTDAKADEALAVIDREFVDINELRVGTDLEVRDLIGEKFPQIDKRALMASSILNGIFDREGVLSLDRIANLKKAEIRQYLRDLPGMTPFVEAYTLLYGFEVSAMPLDDMGAAHLKQAGVVDPAATIEEAQKFIEGHAKPEEMSELFAGLRRHAKENFVAAPPAEEGKAKKKK